LTEKDWINETFATLDNTSGYASSMPNALALTNTAQQLQLNYIAPSRGMGVSKKVALDKDQKYTIGYSFKNKMGISANNFVLLELIKDGSIMYTRKLQATEATTFDYTAPATGEYTWRMRSSSIGTTTTQPLTYSLDNLSIFYSYPYTVENCDNLADGYRFGFNTQEKDDEVYGAGNLNTAMFWEYDTRLGRRWNVDPKPRVGISDYSVMDGNPILKNDPKGDCPTCLSGAIIGAFTEYAGIVGSKMLFNDMTFSDANSSLSLEDGFDITIAAGFGAASSTIDGGISKFTTWISKPTNRKIVQKLLEVGVSALESSLKQLYKDEDFDLTSILTGALAEVGMGNLLKTDVYKNASEQASKNANISTKRAEDLAKRKKPNEKLIKNARKEAATQNETAKTLDNLDKTGKVIKGTVAKISANYAQKKAAPKKEIKKN
jgi:hypothetical protein